jgi:murein DD-endopeptidase MepM/ murein hydrolase activator NlpD
VLTVVAAASFAVAGWQLGAPARPAEAAAQDPGGISATQAADRADAAADVAAALSHGSLDVARLAAAPPDTTVDVAAGLGSAPVARAGNANVPQGSGSVEPEQLTGYIWPLKGGRITYWFQDSPDGLVMMRGKRIHDGLDIATFCGHRVVAAHGGTVLAAGREFGPFIGFDGSLDAHDAKLRAEHDWMRLPRVVVIDDGNGYRSAYVHLGSQSVVPGQVVKAGQVIGKEGATGRASGCHLHYMLIRMDGPLLPVAPELVKKQLYPPMVRERIDPLRVLSMDAPGAARPIPGIDPPAVPYRFTVETDGPAPGAAPGRPQPLVQTPG